jgi:hypothetical protein
MWSRSVRHNPKEGCNSMVMTSTMSNKTGNVRVT